MELKSAGRIEGVRAAIARSRRVPTRQDCDAGREAEGCRQKRAGAQAAPAKPLQLRINGLQCLSLKETASLFAERSPSD